MAAQQNDAPESDSSNEISFDRTLKEIKAVTEELEGRGISVTPLREAVNNLEKHNNNIRKIEDNITSIQQEVINPIRKELHQNRTAGRFSVFGFYVGSVGLIVSVFTILYSSYMGEKNIGYPSTEAKLETIIEQLGVVAKHTESNVATAQDEVAETITQRLDSIHAQISDIKIRLLFPEPIEIGDSEFFLAKSYQPDGEYHVRGSKPPIIMSIHSIVRYPDDHSDIVAGISFTRDGRALNASLSEELGVVRSDGIDTPRSYFDDTKVAVSQGDIIDLGVAKFTVLEIYSNNPLGRVVGDEKSGVKFDVSYDEIE